MLLTQAMARLRLNSQSSTDPVLTDQELADILSLYALEDVDGRAPDDEDWIGTWDLQAAYRKAWLIKAAKVAPEVDYDADGARYSQSQMHAHCMKMADSFGHIGVISLGVE